MGFWKMAAGGAVILGLLENFRELHGFRTTEYDIRSEKMRGEARVLFLSDLHNHRYGFRNRRLVEAAHEAGRAVHVWTVNRPAELKSMALLGADNLITDYPARAREILYEEAASGGILDSLRMLLR